MMTIGLEKCHCLLRREFSNEIKGLLHLELMSLKVKSTDVKKTPQKKNPVNLWKYWRLSSGGKKKNVFTTWKKAVKILSYSDNFISGVMERVWQESWMNCGRVKSLKDAKRGSRSRFDKPHGNRRIECYGPYGTSNQVVSCFAVLLMTTSFLSLWRSLPLFSCW